ncbi:hypothetical protein X777_06406 [Ooceraea biroi]|uniref:G domain-containing protein n=1 Tax=Ooceraea biroi TaxID=2015173 RepID=A0A026WB51_OOCBI|nr:hypothetical protein X777_06406 [Ooceraea biroi]
MLSISNIKMINFAKHLIWKNHTGNTYSHLRSFRDKYKHVVQAFNYCTEYNTIDVADVVESKSSVDPRVEALREKLLFCDHLDHHKVEVGYLMRFKQRKIAETKEKRAKTKTLINVPVYSVFLDNDKGDDNDLPKENTNIEEEDVIRPVHMPYASTDEYTSVDTSLNNSEKNKNASDQSFDENITSLNEKYMALYDKYLEAKTAVSGEEKEVTLKDYMKEFETTGSYKTDFSTVPPNWMVDFEEFDDTLEEDTWFKNYGTPDPNSSVSLVPCGGCGAFLHCRDPAIPGYLPSELFQRKSERRLRRMICQRCHFLKYYNTALDVKVSPDEYINLLKVIKRKKCAVILMVDLTDFPCSIWPDISSVLSPGTAVFVVGNKIDLLPQDSKGFFVHVKECLSKAVENTGIPKENIKHVELVSAQTGYGIEQLINKLHSLWKYKGDVYLIGCTNPHCSMLYCSLITAKCKPSILYNVQPFPLGRVQR